MDIKNKDCPPIATKLLTHKQLEREVAHQFQALNRQILGCCSQKASCTIFNNYLNIVVENAITPLESTMYEKGQIEMLCILRQTIDHVLKDRLSIIIQEVTSVEVKDLVCQLSLDTGRLIAMAVLSKFPPVRSKKHSKIASDKRL